MFLAGANNFFHSQISVIVFLVTRINSYYIKLKEKAMALHSSTLAWKIPWKEEPGRLQSMGSRKVGHD